MARSRSEVVALPGGSGHCRQTGPAVYAPAVARPASVLALLLLAWTGAARAQPVAVIPPGQEAVVRRMLGDAELPPGCAFEGAAIEASRVVGRYRCAGEEHAIRLTHLDASPREARRTARFGLSGDAPGPLLDAVASSVRAAEADFEWATAASRPPEPEIAERATAEVDRSDRAPPRVTGRPWIAAACFGLFLLLLAAVARLVPADEGPSGVQPPPARAALASLVLAAAAVRVAAALWLPWDTDEVTVLPSGGWLSLVRDDADLLLHPPLHRLLVAWLPGISHCPPRWLPRLPSVLAGVAALPVLYAMARPRLGPRGALLPVALVAVTPFDVFVSALARPYALASLAAVVAGWGALAALEGRASRRHWAGACVGLFGALWSDYLIGAAVLVGLVAALASRRARGRPTAAATAAVGGAAFLGAAPWAGFVLAGTAHHAARHADAADPWPLGEGLGEALVSLGGGWTGGEISAGLCLLFLLGGTLRPRTRPLAATALAVAIGAAIVAQLVYMRPRNVAFVTPLIALAVTYAWQEARGRGRAVAIGLAALLLVPRAQQAVELAVESGRPAQWASEVRLGRELARVGPRLPLGREPILVDVEQDARVISRNLFGDRCLPVLPPDDPRVLGGEALGAVRGCDVPELPASSLYLRRHRCMDAPSDPRCRLERRRSLARLYRCGPSTPSRSAP